MLRAFYRVPVGAVAPGASEGDFDVRVLLALEESWVVMAPEPRPTVAAAIGAGLLALSWESLWETLPVAEREAIFHVRVKRDGRIETVPIKTLGEGEIARTGPIPPTRYLGDPPPRPLNV